MSKRTRKEFEAGPGTRGPIVRERTPQVVESKTIDQSEEDLTNLGEMEDAANSEAETAELDSVETVVNPPGSRNGEASPMSFSNGGID